MFCKLKAFNGDKNMLEKAFNTINKKLTATFLLIVLITAIGLGAISLIGFSKATLSAKNLAKLDSDFLGTYHDLKLDSFRISSREVEYMLYRNNKYLSGINEIIGEMIKDIEVVRKEEFSEGDKKNIQILDKTLISLGNYRTTLDSLINLKNSDKFKGFVNKKKYLDEQINLVSDSLEELLVRERKEINNTVSELNEVPGFINRIIALFFAVIFVMIFFTARIVSKRIVTPLNHLVDLSRSASEGDLTKRIVSGDKDEFGTVMSSCNKMVEHIKSLIKRIKDTGKDVDIISSELLDISRTQANNSLDQTSSLSETTGLVQDLDEISREISESTEFVAQLSETVLKNVRNGQIIIEDTINFMEEAKLKTKLMMDGISNLGSQSKEISSVIGIINDIAEQTDLLALNAAIEAARAGDAGKGFAVVASEIKSLAEEVVESTLKIKNIMTMVQKSTSFTVQNSSENAKIVEDGLNVAKGSGESFSKTLEAMKQLDDIAQKISIMTNRQKLASTQALTAIQLIVERSGELTASFDKTSLSAEKLNKLVRHLNRETDAFVLEKK